MFLSEVYEFIPIKNECVKLCMQKLLKSNASDIYDMARNLQISLNTMRMPKSLVTLQSMKENKHVVMNVYT